MCNCKYIIKHNKKCKAQANKHKKNQQLWFGFTFEMNVLLVFIMEKIKLEVDGPFKFLKIVRENTYKLRY